MLNQRRGSLSECNHLIQMPVGMLLFGCPAQVSLPPPPTDCERPDTIADNSSRADSQAERRRRRVATPAASQRAIFWAEGKIQKFRKGVGGQRGLARRNPSKPRDLGLFSVPLFLCPGNFLGSFWGQGSSKQEKHQGTKNIKEKKDMGSGQCQTEVQISFREAAPAKQKNLF